MSDLERGRIIIDEDISTRFETLKEQLSPHIVEGTVLDDFLLDDAKKVIAKAYVAESSNKYLILCAKKFGIEAQNALLKVLEEPPSNIIFIIVAPTASVLLPTIRSRLMIESIPKERRSNGIDIDLINLTIDQMLNFVSSAQKKSRHGSKEIVEQIFYQALYVQKMKLGSSQLDAFTTAFRLLELNGNLRVVLVMLLSQFLKDREQHES